MSAADLLATLQDFYRDTLELFQAREINARSVAGYDANNAYQQVLGRQEVHLRWVSDAIADLGGTPADAAARAPDGGGSRGEARAVIEADARSQRAFIEGWAPRVAAVGHARNRKMLALILGEMKEHLRMLEQATEGRSDVLGRHTDGKVLRGKVLAFRPGN